MLHLRDRAARIAAPLLLGAGRCAVLVCAWLSYRRHLHVDELSGLYSIQLGAAFGHAEYGIDRAEQRAVPTARLVARLERALVRRLPLCSSSRSCSRCAGASPACSAACRARSVEPVVFLGAVSFGPLWRHGFEVRHDIFVAFAVVLLAWAAERARLGRLDLWAASATGFGMIVAQANSSKAFTIWLPGLALCALLAARGERPWLKRVSLAGVRFLPGILLGCALVAGVLGSAGMLGEYWQQLRQFTSFSSAPPYRLSALPLLTLRRRSARPCTPPSC